MRRLYFKKPTMQTMMRTILSYYHEQGCEGTMHAQCCIDSLSPSSPLNDPAYSLHKPKIQALGPIGLALHSLHGIGAAIDKEFVIHAKNEGPISVMELPHQMMEPLLQEVAARARTGAPREVLTVDYLRSTPRCGKHPERHLKHRQTSTLRRCSQRGAFGHSRRVPTLDLLPTTCAPYVAKSTMACITYPAIAQRSMTSGLNTPTSLQPMT